MGKKASPESIRSADGLVSLVDRVGKCYLFRKDVYPRLHDMVKGKDAFTRRGLLLGWAEEAHLGKRLLLSVDGRGSLQVVSLGKIRELSEASSRQELSGDEKKLLGLLVRPMSTPELRKALGISKNRFQAALVGARSKMRIVLVGVRKESNTKYVNIYNRMEKWL